MTLQYAESLIRQYSIVQSAFSILPLRNCSMLYKVTWSDSAPRFIRNKADIAAIKKPIHQRRCSEKTVDRGKAYESVDTILDDSTKTDEDYTQFT